MQRLVLWVTVAVVTATNQSSTTQSAVATDGVHVYWGAGGSIRRAKVDAPQPCDGTGCEAFGPSVEPTAIAIDAKAVYWTDHSSGPNGGVYKRVK